MRNLRYYLISLAIHAVVLGLLACVITWKAFTPPQFSLRRAAVPGSTAVDDGDAVVLEGEFLPCSQMTRAPHRSASRNTSRGGAQRVDRGPNHRVGAIVCTLGRNAADCPKGRAADSGASPCPAPFAGCEDGPARRGAGRKLPPSPPEPHRDRAGVDVGELLKGSAGAQAAPSSGDGPSDSQHGGLQTGGRSGGGGGSDGLPSGAERERPPALSSRGIGPRHRRRGDTEGRGRRGRRGAEREGGNLQRRRLARPVRIDHGSRSLAFRAGASQRHAGRV